MYTGQEVTRYVIINLISDTSNGEVIYGDKLTNMKENKTG